MNLDFSPIKGPEGNIEYLGYLKKAEWEERAFNLSALVEASHGALKEGEGV